MPKIAKAALLLEKPSRGNYHCPHFVAPETAQEIAVSVGRQLDRAAAKAVAEIAENFAAEILRACPQPKPTAGKIRDLVSSSELI